MKSNDRGIALVTVLLIGASLFLFTAAIVLVAQNALRHSRKQTNEAKVEYLAEAGLERALANLGSTSGWLNSDQGDPNFNDVPLQGGMYDLDQIIVDGGDRIVTSHGYIPAKASPLAQITVRARVSLSPRAFKHALFSAGEFECEGSAGTTVSGAVFASDGFNEGFNRFVFDTVAAKSNLYFMETPSDNVDQTLLTSYGSYVKSGASVTDIALPEVNYIELVNPSNFPGQSVYIVTPPTDEHPEGSLWSENGRSYYALAPAAADNEHKEKKLFLDISLINSSLGGQSQAGSIVAVDFTPYFNRYGNMEDELVVTNTGGLRGDMAQTGSSVFAYASEAGEATGNNGVQIEISGANITFSPKNNVALISGEIDVTNSSGTVTIGTETNPAIIFATSALEGTGSVYLSPQKRGGDKGHVVINGTVISAGDDTTIHGKGNGTTVDISYDSRVLDAVSSGFGNALSGGDYTVQRKSIARSR